MTRMVDCEYCAAEDYVHLPGQCPVRLKIGESKMSVRAWAIQDEATGEWWSLDRGWQRVCPVPYGTYHRAVQGFAQANLSERPLARIVPAPPREMTDAEAYDWLQTTYDDGELLRLSGWYETGKKMWAVRTANQSDNGGTSALALGATPCDAIRAARRKIEGGK